MSLPMLRTNQLACQAEAWRPPAHEPATGWRGHSLEMVRRLLDLQYASVLADVRKVLPLLAGDVVDAGCGSQPFRRLFSTQVRYKGIDTKQATEHFAYSTPDTTYYDGEVWPVPTGSVDAVLCTEVLEHVPDAGTFLSEAARCLRTRGVIILTTPFSARWHYIPHDYLRFTPSGLRLVLEANGFRVQAIYARGNSVTVAVYKLLTLLYGSLGGLRQLGFGSSLRAVVAALSLLPLLPLLLVAGHLSLIGKGGDDCLGYTTVAVRDDP